jgi:hypothetical protein
VFAEALTPQIEAYCRERAKGVSQEAAYRLAYRNAHGKQTTIVKNAKTLEKQVKVRRRITELLNVAREVSQREVNVAKTDVLRELWDNAMKAKQAEPVYDNEGNPIGEWVAMFQASNRALELIGKELGMFREQQARDKDPLEALSHEQVKALIELAEQLLRTASRDDHAGAAPVH